MLPDRLIAMANQIGKFFAVQGMARGGEEQAVSEIATHFRRFWDPRMRDEIVAFPPELAARLDPLPRRAVALLATDKDPRITDTDAPVTEMEEPTSG